MLQKMNSQMILQNIKVGFSIEFLKRLEDHRVQARLAAAQLRQEATRSEEDEVECKKRGKEDEPNPGFFKRI